MCKCIVCGKENYPIDTSKFPDRFCSYHCYEKWLMFNNTPNCKCAVCGRPMYLKQYRINRAKNGVVCSDECNKLNRAKFMSGEGNHQYGIKGKDNASFKGELIYNDAGYILEYRPDHPKANNRGRVLQHRLVVEDNHELFDSKFFSEIDGSFILKDEFVVHHKNEIVTDNRIENLQIMTKGDHIRLHNSEKVIIRDNKTGRIIGVSKSGNIGEGCDANTEINSEIKESESSYSIEDETQINENIIPPRVPDINKNIDENICGTVENNESTESRDKKL